MNYKEKLLKIWVCFCGILVISTTIFIFAYIFYKGAAVVTFDFIFDKPRGIPLGTAGGIFPALIGTIYLGALSGLLGGIIGLATSIYLVFYCENRLIGKLINSSIYFLSGIPSILFGLVGYTLLIHEFGLARSLLTACLTVSVMIVPFITMRLIKIFKEDSSGFLNASLCLGLSKFYIIRKLIMPNYFIEILTSVTLGMAYGMGATAPVMFTGAVIYAETPKVLTQPFMTLSYHLYILVNDGISIEHAYGTASVLMFLLLSINIICRILERFREGAGWKIGRK